MSLSIQKILSETRSVTHHRTLRKLVNERLKDYVDCYYDRAKFHIENCDILGAVGYELTISEYLGTADSYFVEDREFLFQFESRFPGEFFRVRVPGPKFNSARIAGSIFVDSKVSVKMLEKSGNKS